VLGIGILAGILLGAIGAVGVGAVGAALESATTMRTLFAALWSSQAPKPSIEGGMWRLGLPDAEKELS
jgi:hypothetical protein